MSNYAQFHAAVLQNLPKTSSEVRQGWIENPAGLARVLSVLAPPAEMVQPAILRLISEGEDLTVGPCDGTRTIVQSSDVFTGGIDENFQYWGTKVAGKSTGLTKASVYELVQDATSKQMFNSLGVPLDQLCWEQDQIIDFVLKNLSSLRKNAYPSLLLFKVGDKFFVARVGLRTDDQPYAYIDRFSGGLAWCAENRRQMVVPLKNGGPAQLPLKP